MPPSQDTIQRNCFSALQRAEIAEIVDRKRRLDAHTHVSVLFNEPKLLKFVVYYDNASGDSGFSALQRAEIAEIVCNVV